MQQVRDLANLSASMDRAPGKIAVVATDEVQLGLARMYEALRAANPRSQRELETFRSRDEAMEWLGLAPRRKRPTKRERNRIR